MRCRWTNQLTIWLPVSADMHHKCEYLYRDLLRKFFHISEFPGRMTGVTGNRAWRLSSTCMRRRKLMCSLDPSAHKVWQWVVMHRWIRYPIFQYPVNNLQITQPPSSFKKITLICFFLLVEDIISLSDVTKIVVKVSFVVFYGIIKSLAERMHLRLHNAFPGY